MPAPCPCSGVHMALFDVASKGWSLSRHHMGLFVHLLGTGKVMADVQTTPLLWPGVGAASSVTGLMLRSQYQLLDGVSLTASDLLAASHLWLRVHAPPASPHRHLPLPLAIASCARTLSVAESIPGLTPLPSTCHHPHPTHLPALPHTTGKAENAAEAINAMLSSAANVSAGALVCCPSPLVLLRFSPSTSLSCL